MGRASSNDATLPYTGSKRHTSLSVSCLQRTTQGQAAVFCCWLNIKFGTQSELITLIQALEAAVVLRDISQMPQYHLHPLKNKGRRKLKGYYAIDICGRREPWRVILQPLDSNHEAFDSTNIDEIAGIVRVVKIEQVSKHYE